MTVKCWKPFDSGVVMGNAPDDMKKRFSEVTLDNNNDGISLALKKFSKK